MSHIVYATEPIYRFLAPTVIDLKRQHEMNEMLL